MKFLKKRRGSSTDGFDYTYTDEGTSHSMWSLKKLKELLKRKGLC